MRYGLFALALTAFVALAASPVLADCGANHTQTSQVDQPSTVASTTPVQQSKPSGS